MPRLAPDADSVQYRPDAVPACWVRDPRGNRRRAARPLHLTWCAVWPASHKYRWRTTMPESPRQCAGLRRENQRPVYRRTCDDNHKTITLLVTDTDQAVIATVYPARTAAGAAAG